MLDRLAGAGRSGDQQVRHRREVGDVRLAVDRLAERDRQLRRRAAVAPRTRAARAARSARALRFGIWMPTVDLPGMRSISTDSACIARHRSSARPVIFAYFTPASGLNSNVVTTGPGWIWTTLPSTENSRHFSSSSRARVHQLALVDLALGLRRVEQRDGRQRVVALAALGRRLRRSAPDRAAAARARRPSAAWAARTTWRPPQPRRPRRGAAPPCPSIARMPGPARSSHGPTASSAVATPRSTGDASRPALRRPRRRRLVTVRRGRRRSSCASRSPRGAACSRRRSSRHARNGVEAAATPPPCIASISAAKKRPNENCVDMIDRRARSASATTITEPVRFRYSDISCARNSPA